MGVAPLRSHLALTHFKCLPYSCTFTACGMSYPSEAGLTHHMESEHGLMSGQYQASLTPLSANYLTNSSSPSIPDHLRTQRESALPPGPNRHPGEDSRRAQWHWPECCRGVVWSLIQQWGRFQLTFQGQKAGGQAEVHSQEGCQADEEQAQGNCCEEEDCQASPRRALQQFSCDQAGQEGCEEAKDRCEQEGSG